MLLISKYKMTYSIEDYLSDIPLQQGKKVEMSLLAEQITTGEEERQAHLRSSVYDISVLITVDGREYALPLAKVMKANRRGIAYGTKQEELYDVSTIVRELGFSRGAILEGFFSVSQLGLEQAMSSDSILYVFDGFIQYVQAIGQKRGVEQSGYIRINGHDIGVMEVGKLGDVVTPTMFKGYRDRVLEDMALLRREESGVREYK